MALCRYECSRCVFLIATATESDGRRYPSLSVAVARCLVGRATVRPYAELSAVRTEGGRGLLPYLHIARSGRDD